MKRLIGFIAVLLLAAVVLYGWFEFQELSYIPDSAVLAKQSVLVIYATFHHDNPKNPLIVKEVWKDARATKSPLIGIDLNYYGVSTNDTLDGMVIFFKTMNNDDPRTYFAVRKGIVDGVSHGKDMHMDLDQYKRACGLE